MTILRDVVPADCGAVMLKLARGYIRHVHWGQPWQLGSAAFWVEHARESTPPPSYQLGDDLREEVAACILGGYGIPADIALAAFESLRRLGILDANADYSINLVERALQQPLNVGTRKVQYRFARQRAHRLYHALTFLSNDEPPADPLALRAWLLQIPGVGPKTASWIVRNHLASDAVAIIDIHVRRAGVAAGIFDAGWRVETHYDLFEAAFLEWARCGDVSAALLDAYIWATLSGDDQVARDVLGVERLTETPPLFGPSACTRCAGVGTLSQPG